MRTSSRTPTTFAPRWSCCGSFTRRGCAPGTPTRTPAWIASPSREHPALRTRALHLDCGLVYRNPVERDARADGDLCARRRRRTCCTRCTTTQLPAVRVQAKELRRRHWTRWDRASRWAATSARFSRRRATLGSDFEGLDINRGVNAFIARWDSWCTTASLSAVDPGAPFDAVAIWNTFDQLADPRRVVNAARRRLRSGGVFALRVPNGEFYGELRGSVTTGAGRESGRAGAIGAEQPSDVPLPLGLFRAIAAPVVSAERVSCGARARRRARAGRGRMDPRVGACSLGSPAAANNAFACSGRMVRSCLTVDHEQWAASETREPPAVGSAMASDDRRERRPFR